jgi:hypothetical protein
MKQISGYMSCAKLTYIRNVYYLMKYRPTVETFPTVISVHRIGKTEAEEHTYRRTIDDYRWFVRGSIAVGKCSCHTSPRSAKEWSYTSAPLYIFTAWKGRDTDYNAYTQINIGDCWQCRRGPQSSRFWENGFTKAQDWQSANQQQNKWNNNPKLLR